MEKENFKIKIGEIYATRLMFLTHQEIQYVDDEKTTIDYPRTISSFNDYSVHSLNNNTDLHSISVIKCIAPAGVDEFNDQNKLIDNEKYNYMPLFIKYLGNGYFEDILTNKKIMVYKDNCHLLEDDYNPTYTKHFTVSALSQDAVKVIDTPLCLSYLGYLSEITQQDVYDYSHFSKEEMIEVINATEKKACRLLMDSINNTSSVETNIFQITKMIEEAKNINHKEKSKSK